MQSEAITKFGQSLRGRLITRSDPDYDEARALYNGMIDKRPLLIARCADVADVIAAVNFGRDNGLLIAIRGGGHNGPGLGSCDDGLVVDLSAMKRIVIDPRAQTARVQPGVTTAELEHASFRWGLAPLVDRHGFVLANLIAAHVVLPDGELVAADDELLREIRIGRALGIVVDATYRLHPAADLRR